MSRKPHIVLSNKELKLAVEDIVATKAKKESQTLNVTVYTPNNYCLFF